MFRNSGIVHFASTAVTTLALAYGSLAHAQAEEPNTAPTQPTAADHSQAPASPTGDDPTPQTSPVGTDLLTLDTSGGFCSDATSPAGVKRFTKWASPFWGRNSPDSKITIGIQITEKACLALPISLNVPNQQAIVLDVKNDPDQTCTATETVAALPDLDIGAIFAKFLGGFAANFAGGGTHAARQFPVNLPALTNLKATISVSCKSADGTPVAPPRTITITYQNMSPVSASAGAIVSLLGSKTYGIVTSETSVTNAIVSSQYAIGVTSSSTIQLVPVAFLNTYVFGNRNKHIDLQTGLGIN